MDICALSLKLSTVKLFILKRYLFLLIPGLFASAVFSQQVVNRKRTLPGGMVEKFHSIIEKDKELKQGLYQAFYRKVLIANGQYDRNLKAGIWDFYDQGGAIIEKINFDNNNLLDEAVEDSTSNFRYVFDETTKPGDRLTKPIRIGGRFYGYLPYLSLFRLPADMEGIKRENFVAVLELLVSPGGMLADAKVHLNSSYYKRTVSLPIDRLPQDDKLFFPSTLNRKAISCRIFVTCYLEDDDLIL
jgi:hypothetical protein